MLLFVIATIAIALVFRRNPLNVLKAPFRLPLLVIVSLFVQIALALAGPRIGWINNVLLPLSFLGVLVWVVLNRSIPGLRIVAVGVAINLLALLVHGGQMPVSEDSLRIAGIDPSTLSNDTRHFQAHNESFWWITDFIPAFGHVYSPGDLIVGIGLIRFIWENSRGRA